MTHYQIRLEKIRRSCYSNQRQMETVIGTRHYINSNFDKDLNLDLLSRIGFTSKFHLLRLFKKYYGQTPQQYMTDKRIEKAKELLRNGATISETCFDVGFDSPSSFCTLFKSRTGITASDFQKRAIFAKSN